MNILQVIHGFPPYYMAGSEIYTYNLCRELAKAHQVSVFTRIENPYSPDYTVSEAVENGIRVLCINKPSRDYTFRDKFLDARIDDAFRAMVRNVKPDIVHIGHLSHLSTQIPIIAKQEFNLPVVFTIHDFWMHCFRGQLVKPDISLCCGPSQENCLKCARHFFKEWMDEKQIKSYRVHMQRVLDCIDLFLAPSHTLEKFYLEQGIPESKIRYSPYGFETTRIKPLSRKQENGPVRIGFMGRIIPVKGIDLLIKAFMETSKNGELLIWGDTGSHLRWLKEIAGEDRRIKFKGVYDEGTVQSVLEGIDVLVVPSVWLENAPLVIQEALLAKLPLIVSNAGGMSELVQHGKNGYLFPLGDKYALRDLLNKVMDDPSMMDSLDMSGVAVRAIADDAQSCGQIYQELRFQVKNLYTIPHRPAPWRVTFVTNPGQCNLHCSMCDTHSLLSTSEINHTNRSILPFEVIERTVLELLPHGLKEIIPSTMGEPLLYKDFDRFLALAEYTNIKVNLTTNGTFPLGGVDKWATKLLPVISDIKFSVNGVSAKTNQKIMCGIHHEEQISNIIHYIEMRDDYARQDHYSTITLQVTFMESNLLELPALLRWAIEHGVDRFKGHHLWVTWPELEIESLRRSQESAMRWNSMVEQLKSIASRMRSPSGRLIRLDNVALLNQSSPKVNTPEYRCPFLGQEAWVEADGSFRVCCCPDEKRSEFGDFGSVTETGFLDIWYSPKYIDFLSNWGTSPVCHTCTMRHIP